MVNNIPRTTNWIIRSVYADIIKQFSTNIGNRTIYKTVITEDMIDIIKKRYLQLCRKKHDLLEI